MSKRKGLKKETKELYSSLIRSLFLCFVALFAIVTATVAWFVNNSNVSGGGANVTATDGISFLLATKQEDKQGLYDDNSSFNNLSNILKEFYRNSGGNQYSSFENLPILKEGTDTVTIDDVTYIIGNDDGISLMVNNESNVNNHGDKKLMEPGSSGSFTFYIIPKVSDLDSVKISIYLKLFKIIDSEEPEKGKSQLIEYIGNETLFNMFMGHLLMFRGVDEDGNYENRLTPEIIESNLVFNLTVYCDGLSIDEVIPVSIYWNWPKRLENILYSGAKDSLFKSECKEKDALVMLINNHKNWFVSSTTEIGDSDLSQDISNSKFSLWSSGYNKGDQLIGNSVAYFEWVIEAK